jgi:hypothetical protein
MSLLWKKLMYVYMVLVRKYNTYDISGKHILVIIMFGKLMGIRKDWHKRKYIIILANFYNKLA